jgi:ABC-2 type transport system permease protein
VPGLIMLTLLSESTSNASFGIYMPRFTGAIYELLSAPVGTAETLIGFVGAAALKSLIIAAIILGTATLFVDYSIAHPVLAVGYIVLVAGGVLAVRVHPRHLGRRVREAVDHPDARAHPADLPRRHVLLDQAARRTMADDRPVQPGVLSDQRLRWTFMGKADVSIGLAFGLTMAFVVLCIAVVAVIFRTGWRLRG